MVSSKATTFIEGTSLVLVTDFDNASESTLELSKVCMFYLAKLFLLLAFSDADSIGLPCRLSAHQDAILTGLLSPQLFYVSDY